MKFAIRDDTHYFTGAKDYLTSNDVRDSAMSEIGRSEK